ncbi:hypothetical protein [Sporomusa malonica]
MKRRRQEYQTENVFEYLAAPDNPQATIERKEVIASILAALKEITTATVCSSSYCGLWF